MAEGAGAGQGAASAASGTPPALAGRVLLALIVGQLGLHAAMSGLRLAAPLQALREGYSAWAVGLLLALFAAAPVVLALKAGRLADRWGYHRPLRLSAAIALAGMLMAVLVSRITGPGHFALLCLAATLAGSAANLGMLATQRTAGLAARSDTDRVRIFSWLGIAPSFANVLGPVAAGFMIDAQGFSAAYLLLLGLPLATVLSVRSVPHWPRPAPAAAVPGRRAWDILDAPGMKRLLLVNWLLSMCWDVHAFAVPILGHERGFQASTIGLVLGSFTLSVTAVRMVVPALARHMHAPWVLPAAMLGTAAVFVVYPFAATPAWMGLCAVLLGVTLGAVQPVVMNTLHHLTPDQRHGEALAFRSMAINASSTVMPLVFGASGAVVGAGVLFWAVGAAVGSGAWLAGRFRP